MTGDSGSTDGWVVVGVTENELQGMRDRLVVLEAIELLAVRGGEVLTVIGPCESVDQALEKIREHFSLTAEQADTVLATQFRTVVGVNMAAISREAAELRDRLEVT